MRRRPRDKTNNGVRQLIDSSINIIMPSRIPVILFYFILFYCKWASGLIATFSSFASVTVGSTIKHLEDRVPFRAQNADKEVRHLWSNKRCSCYVSFSLSLCVFFFCICMCYVYVYGPQLSEIK